MKGCDCWKLWQFLLELLPWSPSSSTAGRPNFYWNISSCHAVKWCPYKALWFVGHRWHRVFLIARHWRNEQFQKNKQIDSHQHRYIWVVAAVLVARFIRMWSNPGDMTYVEGEQPNLYRFLRQKRTYTREVTYELDNRTSCKSPCQQQQQMGTGTVRDDETVMVTINSKGNGYAGLSNIP